MKRKDIKQKIKNYFFENPTKKLRVRHIERIVKVPLPSAIKYVKELKKEEILKGSEVSGVKFYSADRISTNFLIEKRLFNIKSIYDSGLIEQIIKEDKNPLVILFGSYSLGEDIEKSDIDLYIEGNGKVGLKLDKFEKILNRKIQIFTFKSIKNIQNKDLANNIINGIVLNGYLEVFKWETKFQIGKNVKKKVSQ